jgi:uncharacterized membrane protein YhaH (DUF805 family)
MSVWQAIWGFGGRISRKHYWLATLIWTIALLIVFLVLGPDVERKPLPTKPPIPQSFLPLLHWLPGGWWIDEKYIKPWYIAPSKADKDLRIAGLISLVVLLYPLLAMSIKRLHDLNLSGWWCFPGLAPHYALQLAPLLSLDGLDSPSLLFDVLSWGAAVVSLIWLIVVGFMDGTAGPNRYGPDPLAVESAQSAQYQSVFARLRKLKNYYWQ